MVKKLTDKIGTELHAIKLELKVKRMETKHKKAAFFCLILKKGAEAPIPKPLAKFAKLVYNQLRKRRI